MTESEHPLHPTDAAWLRTRSTKGPLTLGLIGIVLAPIAIGAIFAALGLHGAIALWRRGVRGPAMVGGLAASGLALVGSVLAALLWGALLVSVFLGRSAMQEAQKWRGRSLPALVVPALGPDGPMELPLHPAAPSVRQALLFVSAELEFSKEAVRAVAEVAAAHAECRLVIVDLRADASRVAELAESCEVRAVVLGRSASLPSPLDAVAAVPTLVVVGLDGRIESALVGVRPRAELEVVFSGGAALPAEAPARVSPDPSPGSTP